MPRPDRLEALDDRDVLPQVREQPEARRQDKVGGAEEDDAEDGHGEEQAHEAQEAPAEVVASLAQLDGPERVADEGKDDGEGEGGVDLAHDLAALPQPDVVHVVAGLLLRLDAHGPEALGALAAFLGGRPVVVALVRVRLDYAQGEHGQREQLEGVLERGAVRDLGQGGVLLARGLVGVGLEGAEGAFDLASC